MTRNEKRWEAAEAAVGKIYIDPLYVPDTVRIVYDAMEARERKQREACADVAINHGSRTGLHDAILDAEAE